MKTYSRVYFLLCLFLAISGRSRTKQKLNIREKHTGADADSITKAFLHLSAGALKTPSLMVKKLRLRLGFFKSRSKVKVKVTRSNFLVQRERSCHKEHTCII